MSKLTSERLEKLRLIAEAAKNRLRRQPGQLHSRLEAEGAIDKLLAEIERLRRELNDLQAEFEAQNSMLGKTIIENDALTKAARKLLDNREEVDAGDDYVYMVPRNDDVDTLESLVYGKGGGSDQTGAVR